MNKRTAVLTGLATFLVGFPFVLAGFSAARLATWHGEGLFPVLVTDAVAALAVGAASGYSKRVANVVALVLMGLLALLVIQAVWTMLR